MNVPSDEFPWVDLGRWFAGELSTKEAESLVRWAAGDSERAAVVVALRQAWTAAGAAREGWDAAAALQRVRRVATDEATVIARLGSGQPAVTSRWSARIRLGLRAAAVVAVISGGTLLISRLSDSRVPTSAVPAGAVEYRTARGQRLTLRLGDGTQVVLAPASVLRRPEDYGRRERRLELEGEAYFIVTHDATRPFAVRTGRLVAQDLGTRFVVRAYAEEAVSEVLVAEGKVALQHQNKMPVVLMAGQVARVDSAGRLVVNSGVDLESGLAWTKGQLVFRDTPLVQVKQQLERLYDVDVRLASPALARLRVSGVFGSQPIAEELATVARALGLTVRRVDGRYELSRSNHSSHLVQ